MKELVTFDDVLIVPKFSTIKSRKEVDISSEVSGLPFLRIPVISANMDTVTEAAMSKELRRLGAAGCIHRFSSIQDNVKLYKESIYQDECSRLAPIVSIGLGNGEFERAEALHSAGARYFCIDVAHGASIEVVNQVNKLTEKYGEDICITVGNFATGASVKHFKELCKIQPKAFKVGIGPGSACTTRIKTGVGIPQLSAIIDCVQINPDTAFIADGGLKTPGDIAKALAAGAKCVMLGGMLAGTDETPGEIVNVSSGPPHFERILKKRYRGSASKQSYIAQGKDTNYRTAEGEAFLVEHKGPVEEIIKDIEGGLRSAFSYVGANNLKEFQQNVEFIKVTSVGLKENGSHGKH